MPDNPFWEFSLQLYRQPGVEKACIRFQDAFGGNVNLLLFCLWLGLQEVKVSREILGEIETLVIYWDKEVVGPIRNIRGALKGVGKQTYIKAKRLELTAERVLQDTLYRWYVEQAPTKSGSVTVTENVITYAGKFCDAENCLDNLLSQLSHTKMPRQKLMGGR